MKIGRTALEFWYPTIIVLDPCVNLMIYYKTIMQISVFAILLRPVREPEEHMCVNLAPIGQHLWICISVVLFRPLDFMY